MSRPKKKMEETTVEREEETCPVCLCEKVCFRVCSVCRCRVCAGCSVPLVRTQTACPWCRRGMQVPEEDAGPVSVLRPKIARWLTVTQGPYFCGRPLGAILPLVLPVSQEQAANAARLLCLAVCVSCRGPITEEDAPVVAVVRHQLWVNGLHDNAPERWRRLGDVLCTMLPVNQERAERAIRLLVLAESTLPLAYPSPATSPASTVAPPANPPPVQVLATVATSSASTGTPPATSSASTGTPPAASSASTGTPETSSASTGRGRSLRSTRRTMSTRRTTSRQSRRASIPDPCSIARRRRRPAQRR